MSSHRVARCILRSNLSITSTKTTTLATRLFPSPRAFTTTSLLKMPEQLTQSDVNSKTDPSVTKQYDRETPTSKQITDFYSIADGLKACLMTTQRASVGPVSRSMALTKREGPDFLFLTNKNSQKWADLQQDKTIQLTFQDQSTQNWASLTGKATVTSNSDPRIKDLVNPFASAWFGDLGDGVHNGKAEDPRMSLIEVKAEYITYWMATTGSLGFLKEMVQSNVTGTVAQTGVTRELKTSALEQARREK